MKTQKQSLKTHRKSAGFTLLELIVALSLGIILLLGLMSVYIVAQQADGQNKAINANDEIARQVFRILDNNLKHAGYVDPMDSPANNFSDTPALAGYPNSACIAAKTTERYGALTTDVSNTSIENIYRRYNNDSKTILPDKLLSPIGRISCGTMQPVLGCGASGFQAPPNIFSASSVCPSKDADSTSQAIEIAYQAKAVGGHGLSNLNTISAGSTATDCTGTETTSAQNGFVVNQFFLTDDNGESSLTCQSNLSSTDVALVQGVTELTFRYITTIAEKDENKSLGESDSGRLLANYQTAKELYDTATDNNNNLDWATVVGVEVCVIVSAPDNSNTLAEMGRAQTNRPTCARTDGIYNDPISKEDRNRYYQRFDRVFSIPNALFLTN